MLCSPHSNECGSVEADDAFSGLEKGGILSALQRVRLR